MKRIIMKGRIVKIGIISLASLFILIFSSCNMDSPYLEEILEKMHSDIGTCFVLYDGNGNSDGTIPVDDNYYLEGWPVAVAENSGNLVKEAYTFIGWNTADDGSGANYIPGDTFEMGSTDVTLYANWSLNPTFTVTYNGNGHTAGPVPADSIEYEVGEVITVLAKDTSFLKNGHTYLRWNTEADGSGTSYAAGDTFAMGIENVTLYAHWSINSYSVSYNANEEGTGKLPSTPTGNPPSAPVSYEYGSTITVLGNTGNFYMDAVTVYNGWNTNTDGSGTSYTQNDTFILSDNDVTLYVQWTDLTTYTVTYNADGGTGAPTDNTNYLPGDTVTLPGVGSLDKGDYTFGGWNTASAGAGTDYAPGPNYVMGSANVTLWVKWLSNPPEIQETADITNLTSTSAQSGGIISTTGGPLVTAKGVCWNTSSGPTIALTTKTNDGTATAGPDSFTSSISGLSPGTTYFVRAYATNSEGTVYGDEISFTTHKLPIVSTNAATNVHATSASCNGNVTDEGGTAVFNRGIYWGTSSGSLPNKISYGSGSGTSSFSVNLSSLTPSTDYYYKAYAENSVGEATGSVVQFEAKYQYGDTGPGGGKVFIDIGSYADHGGDGYGSWRYMEAATSDQGQYVWGTFSGGSMWINGAKYNAVGRGRGNTEAIIAGDPLPSKAADICKAYNGGSKSDWFLPSAEEMKQMEIRLRWTIGLDDKQYWSSSQDDVYIGDAKRIWPGGSYTHSQKNYSRYVRAARRF